MNNNTIFYDLIFEGRNADKAKIKTYDIIRKFFKNNINNINIEKVETKLKEWLFHANIPDAIIRLEPIMMNIALSLGFEQTNKDIKKLKRLKRIMDYIIDNYKKDGFPIQLNKLTLENTTYESLNEMFGNATDKLLQQDNINGNSYHENSEMNPNYEVIEIKDYATAKKYGRYSCTNSRLCYSENNDIWNKFIDYGKNRAYLILNKNWKNIPEEHGKNTPYDDYGLSMIFLFIDEYGEIAYSNTRWNHENKGQGPSNVDQSFTKSMISKLLHINFDSVFKPFNNDEINAKNNEFTYQIKKAKQKLENGEDLSNIFDDITQLSLYVKAVKLNGLWSFINKSNKLTENGEIWFDSFGFFSDNFAIVSKFDKFSFINENGELLKNKNGKILWFDDVYNFYNGLAQVTVNDNDYLVDKTGNIYDIETKKLIEHKKTYNTNTKKQIIRLTENDLRQLILKSIKCILKENKK